MSAVAESDARIIGFCEAAPGEVVGVFVLPECAGGGVGAALLSHAFALAGGPRTRVSLEATLNAVGFDGRFGFRAVRRSVVRRNDVDIPVVVMERPR